LVSERANSDHQLTYT